MNKIKPLSTEQTKIIFQEACSKENRDAKFGRSILSEENDIRKFILMQTPILARLPSIDEIKKAFNQFSNKEVSAALNKLDQLDVIHLDNDKTTIAAAYPFSGSETSHVVTLRGEEYKKIYSMCAVDALGICFMFNCDVSIDSKCHHCGERIEIEINDNEIISLKPKKVVVWHDAEYTCCSATSICKNTNFFSSQQHFAAWRKENPARKGYLLQIEEAFYLGKLYFENRIE